MFKVEGPVVNPPVKAGILCWVDDRAFFFALRSH